MIISVILGRLGFIVLLISLFHGSLEDIGRELLFTPHIFISRVFGKSHKMTIFSFLLSSSSSSFFLLCFLFLIVFLCLSTLLSSFFHHLQSSTYIISFSYKNIQHKTNSKFISLFNLLTRRRKGLFAFDCELRRLQSGENRLPSFILRKHICKMKEGKIFHNPWIMEDRKNRERERDGETGSARNKELWNVQCQVFTPFYWFLPSQYSSNYNSTEPFWYDYIAPQNLTAL